ncbi:sigma factor-like helix-turn-helix DNA-binding protein [Actinokineospora auranticolor]|uniref:Sigma-70-like protein n=1 Tax=Actinokineospora auranticolor TaxID=155976 RepID=A0A2S6GRN5_9PSEU|nr:sigma factor-like helix-turn-helix DNA-binding protein [Actinokineospora auranticolor]PPK67894.1 sigma-70-like protein [Actinokineospora auranticolor]
MPADEQAERRRHDIAVYDVLALEGFRGRNWDRFADDLARYGYATVMAWLRCGEMFAFCANQNRALPAPPWYWTDDDRAELANLTVTTALNDFRRRAGEGTGWNPDGGASIRTYFMGNCVLSFPNHYRRWLGEQERHAPLTEVNGDRHAVDPADLAVTALTAREALDDIPDERTRRAVVLHAQGYTHAEIADLIDTTPRAVEGLLHRQRHRARGEGRQP